MRHRTPEAIVCDKCGAPTPDYATAELRSPELRQMQDHDSYDLCTGCWRDLVSVIQMAAAAPTSEKPDATGPHWEPDTGGIK